jgi:hypothetical protein
VLLEASKLGILSEIALLKDIEIICCFLFKNTHKKFMDVSNVTVVKVFL